MKPKMRVVMFALAGLFTCSASQAAGASNGDAASNLAYKMVSAELNKPVESWLMCPIDGAVIIEGGAGNINVHAVITEDRPGAKSTTYSVALSQKQFDHSLCIPVSTKAVRAALAKSK